MEKLVFPEIVRARGIYVYDRAGNRYLDLYLGDGRLALGHRIPHRLQLIKSILARGLFGDYPHALRGRLKRSFKVFWGNGINVYGFRDRCQAESFLEKYKGVSHAPELWERKAISLCFARWRLGQDVNSLGITDWQFQPLVPSFLGYLTFFIQRVEGGEDVKLELFGEPWDAFSICLVEQSLYALGRERLEPFHHPKSILSKGLWEIKGQVGVPVYGESKHEEIWHFSKGKGILLPVNYRGPLTISKSLTNGDWKLFRRIQEYFLERI